MITIAPVRPLRIDATAMNQPEVPDQTPWSRGNVMKRAICAKTIAQ